MQKLSIDILTLFPEMFSGVFGSSILAKAKEKDLVQYRVTNFREYAPNKHQQVDDYPYGGGGGMVLKPEPIFLAIEDVIKMKENNEMQPNGVKPRIILMCPQGERFDQKKAEELSKEDHLIFICGHYEGYDERIREHIVTDEISIGDFVLTGGELAAMVIVDSVVRLREGVLGNETSSQTDSFSTGLIEYPHYTRPAEFRGMKVPDVLLSGHHQRIDEWRKQQSLLRTRNRRPDLLDSYALSEDEKKWLEAWNSGENKKE
jgi:tRNA (guanine37-N1)-methyltransferase